MSMIPSTLSVPDLPSGQPANAPTPSALPGKQQAAPDNGTSSTAAPLAVVFAKPQRPLPTVIRGLNFDQLATYLLGYEMGTYRWMIRIWNQMRKRDSHLLSVSSKRFKRVSRLDWEITPNDSTPEAIAQAEFLSDFYAAIPEFRRKVRHLLTAHANGISACEIVWKPGAGPDAQLAADLVTVKGDYFDEADGVLKVFADAYALQATPLDQIGDGKKFVIHRADDALMIAGSVLFVIKQIALNQWNAFCDRFGMPGLIGTAPQGASEASRDTLQKIVENWVSTMAAVLPPGYDVKTIAAAISGSMLPARDLVEFCDSAQSVLWAGGNLTSKSEAGSGTLAGGAQREQEIELAQDDAGDLAETFDEQLSKPAVLFQLGQPLLCKFRFKIAQAVDLAAAIAVDDTLVSKWGLRISEADVRAKYGWRMPEPDEGVITPTPSTTPDQLPSIPGVGKEISGTSGIALKAAHESFYRDWLTSRKLGADLAQIHEQITREWPSLERINPRATRSLAMEAFAVALKAGASTSALQQEVDRLVGQHLESGRLATATMIKPLEELVAGAGSLDDIRQRLTRLNLPSGELQQVLAKVVTGAFEAGSNSVRQQQAGGDK